MPNAESRARLRAALKEDSTIWEAWYDLGVIAWREGDDDEAIDDYSKALNIDRNHNSIVLARAEAERRAGKKKEARSDYEAALKAMDEDDPNRRDEALISLVPRNRRRGYDPRKMIAHVVDAIRARQDGVGHTVHAQQAQLVGEERLVQDRHDRLRTGQREGTKTRALSAGEDYGLCGGGVHGSASVVSMTGMPSRIG